MLAGNVLFASNALMCPVNEVLSDHNVDKQMSDSRGEVAYYMADVSNVDTREIKEIYEALEDLSCKFAKCHKISVETLNAMSISSRTYKSLVLAADQVMSRKALVPALLLFRGPCINDHISRRKAFNILHLKGERGAKKSSSAGKLDYQLHYKVFGGTCLFITPCRP